MKDLFFASDLLTLFRHDKHYCSQKQISIALRKFGLSYDERSNNIEQMFHALVVHIMDQWGDSEPFLAGTFIYPEAVIKLLQEKGLPTPAALQPESTTKDNNTESFDLARFEQYFDTICRNCGTVTDPLASSYRSPIGRLIFRTFLETRHNLGINATGRYVLEHLKNFDTEKVVTAVNDDSVIWRTEDSREKMTSVETISKYVLNFNRKIESLL
jgi:hypothetical protein